MATRTELEAFGVEDVCDFLLERVEDIDLETISAFRKNKVNGKAFLLLAESDLRELVQALGERKIIQKLVESFQPKVADKVGARSFGVDVPIRSGSTWLSQFSLPEFSRKTMETLKKGEIKRSTRVEIVHAIALQMWCHTHYPTSEEYTGVLRLLVDKYPVLRDKFGNGIGSWKEQLRQRFSNMRRPSKEEMSDNKQDTDQHEPKRKKRRTDSECASVADEAAMDDIGEESGDDYTENLMLMHKELEKEKPCKKEIKSLMLKTYAGRREWIQNECPPVSEILNLFPSLSSARYLLRELALITDSSDKPVDGMASVWCTLQPKIVKLMTKEAESSSKLCTLQKNCDEQLKQSDPAETDFLKEVHNMDFLFALLSNKVTTGEKKLFHHFAADCEIEEEVRRHKFNFPYIAVVGNEFLLVAERIILCSCKTLMEAFGATIGAYYTFNMEYPLSLKPLLLFGEKILMKISSVEKIPAVINRVYSALDALD